MQNQQSSNSPFFIVNRAAQGISFITKTGIVYYYISSFFLRLGYTNDIEIIQFNSLWITLVLIIFFEIGVQKIARYTFTFIQLNGLRKVKSILLSSSLLLLVILSMILSYLGAIKTVDFFYHLKIIHG